ncbi:MAG TPA: hypothetical protein VNS63_14625, partial [Blastocatellia bacterium]|nr:hypothetical protein [Blastocatellia bacterium]
VSYGNEDAGQGSEMGVSTAPTGGELTQKQEAALMASADLCPTCGDSAFVRLEGCQTCYACGYSEC